MGNVLYSTKVVSRIKEQGRSLMGDATPWDPKPKKLQIKKKTSIPSCSSLLQLVKSTGRVQGTREPENQGTRKPRNQGPRKPRNSGTKEPGDQGTKGLGNQGTRTGKPGNH